jgi:hypothetical protein
MTEPAQKSVPNSSESKVLEGGPTREEIELRAYQIYCERAGTPGSEVEDWLQAETELTEKHRKPGRAAKAAAR